MPATPTWLAALEALLNRGIDSSTQAGALAARLSANTLKLRVDGLVPIRVGTAGGRLALTASDEPADATIGGSPLALLQLARGGAAVSGRSAAARIEGDAEVANRYRQLFALARPDFEEELARIVGDLAARRLSQVARQTFDWVRKAKRTTGDNIAEYLQEESRDLVNKVELDEFLHGVDAVRETADRIEARLARLEQRMKGNA
jgi:ubiquinone biosynthesis accessory factor UbiJ